MVNKVLSNITDWIRWGTDDIIEYPYLWKGGWFDENQNPKPIFYAFSNLMDLWTTNDQKVTSASGSASFTAFGGPMNILL